MFLLNGHLPMFLSLESVGAVHNLLEINVASLSLPIKKNMMTKDVKFKSIIVN
jgi:hypothetical protein